jgi:glycosyltransferase involved in cell wall biosynthesis
VLLRKREASTIVAQEPDFAPARMVEIELRQPLPTLIALDDKAGRHYQRAFCLIRLHTQPLGVVELQLGDGEIRADEYARHIWRALSANINEHLREDGLPPATGLDAAGIPSPGTPRCIEERERFLVDAPFVSVIVPTRDRPGQIPTCLRSLLALHYPQYEIIVVDNAPSTNATADFIQQTYRDVPRVRYLREDRPGVSWARNCGMMAARGEILVFVDDDVVIDPYWLVEFVRGFSMASDVACVTGYILPLELETPAQFWYEEHCGSCWFQEDGGSCWSLTRHIFDLAENHPKTPLYPYKAGFGGGANAAFTAAFLRSVGGFDLALGAGSPAQGGEDLAAFFQAIIRGHKLVCEPAAVGYHPHYREYNRLRKQIYNYGIGLTAYLTKSMLENPRLLFDFIPKALFAPSLILRAVASRDGKRLTRYPRELVMLNLKGMLYGPFAYLHSRWTMRNVCKDFAPVETVQTSAGAKEASVLAYHIDDREEGIYP